MTSHAITKWPQPHGMTRVVGGKEIEGKNGFGDCCFLSTMYISQTSLHIVWKISRNVSFFYNNKIIFDFQIFEFSCQRFKTCYIFYDFNTLCSGSSSTGIMRFAFKLVGGTALVFPGFQLWGAKLENPFFFLDCPLPKFISQAFLVSSFFYFRRHYRNLPRECK